MGDTTNFIVSVRGVSNPLVLKEIKELADNYAYGRYYDVTINTTSLDLGANDVPVGSVEQMVDDLTSLIREGMKGEHGQQIAVQDFAYWVNDDPKYEWLGSVAVHVPGIGDFQGQCDANGSPVFSASELLSLIDKATDLEQLKVDAQKATGSTVIAAYQVLEAS